MKTLKISVHIILVLIIVFSFAGCDTSAENDITTTEPLTSSETTTEEEKLIGKWDSQASPGLSAYVFYDDGTYDNYLSTVNSSGEYTVSGNKLTLINPDTNKEVVYKFKVTSTELTLTLVNDDGEDDVNVFDRVDELNQKTLTDLIGELATESGDSEEETTQEKTTEEESNTYTTSSSVQVCEKCYGLGHCFYCSYGECTMCNGTKKETCDKCIGSGKCANCGGDGYYYSGVGSSFSKKQCGICYGSGRCNKCNGTKKQDCSICLGSGKCIYCGGVYNCTVCGGSGTLEN